MMVWHLVFNLTVIADAPNKIKNPFYTFKEPVSPCIYFPLAENDVPNITTSTDSPQELDDPVTLTCNAKSSEIVTKYSWYFNGNNEDKVNSETYKIGNTREKSGNYTCAVTTATKTSTSEVKQVVFLCKYLWRNCIRWFHLLEIIKRDNDLKN